MPKKLYVALFCGDREWGNSGKIVRELKRLREKHGNRLLIVEGEASGADLLSRFEAHKMNIHVAGVQGANG